MTAIQVPKAENIKSGNLAHLKFLDGLRGLAALYVLLHHTSSNKLELQQVMVGQPFRFGLEAVLVFFILSGFVISYSHELRRRIDWSQYILSRIRRIYPIFIISLLLAYFVNCLAEGSFHAPNLLGLAGNFFMLQDVPNKPGTWVKPFEDNFPLWSLAYEFFFYVSYMAVMIFVKRRFQLMVVGVVSYIGVAVNHFAPNHICNCLVFLPIWWCGCLMGRSVISEGKLVFIDQVKGLMLLVPLFFYYSWVFMSLKAGGEKLALAEFPILHLRFIGESLLLMIMLPLMVKFRLGLKLLESRAALWLGGISYALYALHFPLLCGLPRLMGIGLIGDLVFKFVLIFFVSWVAEKTVQPWVNRVFYLGNGRVRC